MADATQSYQRRDVVSINSEETCSEVALLEERKAKPGRLTCVLILATFAIAFGSSFPMGYHTGVTNIPEEILRRWINQVTLPSNSTAQGSTQWVTGWISAINTAMPVGCIFGSLLAGWTADKLGRKGALLCNNLNAFAAVVLMSTSKLAGSVWQLIVGRLVAGLNVGLNSCLAPMFISEISPVSFRGLLVGIYGIFGVFAILISQIFGLPQLLGTEHLWPLLFAVPAVPAVVQLLILPFCPESPFFLLFVRHNRAAADMALMKLRDDADVVIGEISEMVDEKTKIDSQPKLRWGQLFQPPCRWPLILAIVVMLAQQLSGINAVIFYSTGIFINAGLIDDEPKWATLGVGFFSLLATGLSAGLIERAGRRTLLLTSLAGMLFSTIGLVSFINFPAIAVLSLLLFVSFFSLGTGPIPWLYVTELFSQSARSKASSLACMINWLSVILVTFGFKYAQMALGDWTFLIFTGFLTFFIIFIWKFLPETRNKTVVEIQEVCER